MRKQLMPYVARMISSTKLLKIKRAWREFKRRVLLSPHQLKIFVRINDPYSYLLLQVMKDFLTRFDVEVQYHTVLNLDDDMFPEKEMWHRYAFIDSTHLASLYNISFPKSAPQYEQKTIEMATALLLQVEKRDDFLDIANAIFHDYWFSDSHESDILSSQLNDEELIAQALSSNESLLKKLGHYSSAMIHYSGEWYWGIDRLDHLTKRLKNQRYKKTVPAISYGKTYEDFCVPQAPKKANETNKKLTFFWSARSPYSYIALERIAKLTAFYDLSLEIKPVLPMVMRGLKVPNLKKMYIFLDTKREASKLGIPYGLVADPLGAGVERCYALFDYACNQGKQLEFLLSFARGVNAEGISSESDKGMKTIVERAGLNWAIARKLLTDTSWRSWAKANQKEMLNEGIWGVPSFKYGDLILWGQDRVGILEKAIERSFSDEAS